MRGPAIALLAFCAVALAVTPPWPAIGHDSSRTRFTPNGPAVTKPWNTNTNYSFISSLGPAVDSNGVTYMVGAEGNGCSVVAFDPLTGATHDVLDCPEGTGLSFYTGLVITTNAAGDVLLFPMLAPNGWQMVAVTTGGKSLWSTQITGPIAPPVVSVDGSLVFVLTQSNNQGVVLALDTTTGALSWNTTVTRLGAANIQSSYQLLADNEGAIYVTVMRGHNYAYWNTTLARLSATSGALLWNISLIMGLPTPFVFAPSLSALVYSSEGALIAISTKTGKQLWSQQLPLTTCIGVLMHDPVNGNFYFTCQDSTLLAVNSTGGLLWTYVVKSAPGALGSPSMAVRSPANDTDAGAVVYNGQANLSNLSVPFTALTDTGSLMWSKLISVTYPTVYLVGPNVCVYYSAGTSLNPSVSVSCIPGSFSA